MGQLLHIDSLGTLSIYKDFIASQLIDLSLFKNIIIISFRLFLFCLFVFSSLFQRISFINLLIVLLYIYIVNFKR